MSSAAAGGPKPGSKQLLWDRLGWSKPRATAVPVNETVLFQRSNETFAGIAAEQELRRKRREAKKKQEGTDNPGYGRDDKRRRISIESESENESRSESEDGDGDHIGDDSTNLQSKSTNDDVEKDTAVLNVTPIPEKSPALPDFLARNDGEPVTAASSTEVPAPSINSIAVKEDEIEIPPGNEQVQILEKKNSTLPSYDDFSDEEFPELAQKAREKARSKRLHDKKLQATSAASSRTLVDETFLLRSPSLEAVTPAPPLPEPAVSLLITSTIPNTEPLIVQRKLGQRLKEVRRIWCQRQDFPPEVTETIILTWKGRRLFDVTTCKSLQIGVDEEGNILNQGERDVFGEADRKIHMEATTVAMLEESKRIKEHAQVSSIDVEEPETEGPKPEEELRVVLKAKGYPDHKLIVHPVSFVSKGGRSCLRSN